MKNSSIPFVTRQYTTRLIRVYFLTLDKSMLKVDMMSMSDDISTDSPHRYLSIV